MPTCLRELPTTGRKPRPGRSLLPRASAASTVPSATPRRRPPPFGTRRIALIHPDPG